MLIINGTTYLPGTPETTLLNRSFFFGDGLFEILRVFQGKILFQEQHLGRLLDGMDILQFEYDRGDFEQHIRDNLRKSIQLNQINNHGQLRLHVYREGQGGYAPMSNQPSFLIEGHSFKEDLFQSTVSVSLQSYRDILLTVGPLSSYFHANALPFVLASIHAHKHHRDHAILYHKDWIATTTLGNLFYVSQRKLYTPPLSCGIQAGIMRQQIISLAKKLTIPVEEKRFKAKALLQADEIFLAHPLRGIVSVSAFDNLTLDSHQFAITPFLRNCLLQYIEEIFQ